MSKFVSSVTSVELYSHGRLGDAVRDLEIAARAEHDEGED